MRTLKDYQWLLPLAHAFAYKSVKLAKHSDSLDEILNQHSNLVCASNHGPSLGPMAAIPAMMELVKQAGGTHRKPNAIIWRPFYQMPIVGPMTQYITNSAKPIHVESAVEKLATPFTDVWVMPEGDHCLFDDPATIMPFLSPGFVEIAIRAKTPIMVAVHRGTESWNRSMPIPKLITKRLPKAQRYARLVQQHGKINLPFAKPRLRQLEVAFKLYEPNLKAHQLSNIPKEKKAQLAIIAEEVRGVMINLAEGWQ